MEPPPAIQTLNLSASAYDNHNHLLFPLIYIIVVFILYLCALATIIYSTFHGFISTPVKLVSAIKSLVYSLLPLISTTIVAQLCVLFLCLLPVLIFIVFIKGGETLGFEIDYNSFTMNVLYIFLFIVILSIFVYLQAIWVMAPVIAVVELKWGLEPLRRSSKLVKGTRFISAALLVFFGNLTLMFVWGNLYVVLSTTSSMGWRNWAFVLQIVLGCGFLTLYLLHNVASFTVYYMHCKAFLKHLHDESAFEIAEEFAREYIRLPFYDTKVPHAVTVV